MQTFRYKNNGITDGITWHALDSAGANDWLAGIDSEWIALKTQHDKEVAEHENWLAIQAYETARSEYEAAYAIWWTWDNPDAVHEIGEVKPEMPVAPPKPNGYYTQEEVAASQAAWNEWKTLSDAYVPDEFGTPFSTPEPVVLQRPMDIPEPSITPLPDPVPNTPEPEFTAEELAAQAEAQAKVDRANELAALTVTTVAGNVFDADEVAQERLARAVQVMSLANVATTPWKLNNNKFIDAPLAELMEALMLAAQAQSEIWMKYG